jgi:hypothetical protein
LRNAPVIFASSAVFAVWVGPGADYLIERLGAGIPWSTIRDALVAIRGEWRRVDPDGAARSEERAARARAQRHLPPAVPPARYDEADEWDDDEATDDDTPPPGADLPTSQMRWCERCGQRLITGRRRRLCDSCRRRRPTPLAPTADRGYGAAHRAERERWAPKVARGEVCCARCGRPIQAGEPWDLDHDDRDRSQYLGPSHAACNRATAGRQSPEYKASEKWW